MTVRANKAMKSLVPFVSRELSLLQCNLPKELEDALEEAEFAEIGGLVTFAGSPEPGLEARKDLTGLECVLNKWQMDEYIHDSAPSMERLTTLGICYALALQNKLSHSSFRGELRLIVSCSLALDASLMNTCTVHLHRLRRENPWLNGDIESYDQGVLTIDWLNFGGVLHPEPESDDVDRP